MDEKFMILTTMLSIIFFISGIITITILILDHKHSLKEQELHQLELEAELEKYNIKSGEDNV